MIVLDVETYPDYWLLAMMDKRDGRVVCFERYSDQDFNARSLGAAMARNQTISFNGFGYDLPMIAAALEGWDNASLKRLSDQIITTPRPAWAICRDAGIAIPPEWDHVDIMNVAPGQSSLKIYGGRLHSPRLQDLPYDPDDLIDADRRDALRRYCVNDLQTTSLLHDKLSDAISLRDTMSAEYGMDLRSKSDAQMAETLIKSELTATTGRRYATPKLPSDYGFTYQDPGIVSFETPHLQSVFDRLKQTRFGLDKNGAVQLPEWLRVEPVTIAGRTYRMGIGGLHSAEQNQSVMASDDRLLFDLDVASYYPNIILQQQLAPKTLGREFLDVYQSIVDRRLHAKRTGDGVTNAALKIAVNGSFGKFGSKYSALYSPDLLIQTTITGQLALLMLIERVIAAGADVVSANTDGIVVSCPVECESDVERAAWGWMLDTTYELERTDYRLMASRDVNNYLAVKVGGGTKGKGAFASPSLMKNPDGNIFYTAVIAYAESGTPVAETINGCDDIRQFLTVRTVKGGAVWRGEALGKAVRFYASTSVPADEPILYATNGHKVARSDGCRPVMDLPGQCPDDIDRQRYIERAEKLLCEVGLS